MSLTEEAIIFLHRYWYIIFIVLYSINKTMKHIHTNFLMTKFKASPPTNYVNYKFFGIPGTLIELKHLLSHTSIDYAIKQFDLVPFPHVHTFVTKVLGNKLIMTKDPENIKVLLSSGFDKFDYGSRSSAVQPSLGMGIFTLEGKNWKETRSVLMKLFGTETITQVHVFEPHFLTLQERINQKTGFFDIQEEFMTLGLEISTELLFGEVVSHDTPHYENFTRAWDFCQNYMIVRLLLGDLYWLANDWRYTKSNQIIHEFCDYLVQRSLEKNPDNEKFVIVHELDKHTKNKTFIRDQALSLIMASRDTTAELMAFTMLEMARNPEIWEKLRDIVNVTFNKESPELLNFSSLRNCKYVRAILKETLRIYPGVPRNMKTAKCDTILPKGGGKDGQDPILVQKGQPVGFISIATQMDPVYFGTDAHVYNPERWFQSNMKNLGCKYLPFNAGPRTCLGQQYTLIEASYLLVRLAQTYETIELHPDYIYPPRKKSFINMSAADGVVVQFHK